MELMLFLLWLITMFLFSSQRLDASAEPVLLDRPFVTVWNAPTQQCWEKYQVELDLSVFDIVINPNQSFIGQEMTIFYSTQLGYYPYYTDNGTVINGGIPQNASLKDHLLKAKKDVEAAIVNSTFSGLAVVDWEAWRPLWARNWNKMKIYRDRSTELITKLHPDWPHDRVVKEAQQEFENAGRAFMKQTLALCQELRPSGFWGFYGFPSCYNFEYKNSTFNYTGQCPEITIKRNDQLSWLWKQSQILYPEIYLEKELKLSKKALKFVGHRVQEALRVGAQVPNRTLPVLPYARIVYAYTMDFLAEVREALPVKYEGPGHQLPAGQWVLIKNFERASCLVPRWKGQHQDLLATQTTLQVAGKKNWIHSTLVKRIPFPLPYDKGERKGIGDLDAHIEPALIDTEGVTEILPEPLGPGETAALSTKVLPEPVGPGEIVASSSNSSSLLLDPASVSSLSSGNNDTLFTDHTVPGVSRYTICDLGIGFRFRVADIYVNVNRLGKCSPGCAHKETHKKPLLSQSLIIPLLHQIRGRDRQSYLQST
ncbi:hyaluronidase-1-like isoform X1 [Ambystoma mexicanum]|uniref:hyaluronidase-1-like isoform X1 n=1 Tax=Ambystoma mexicanum TaxID=8296 RepID=UPI0037E959B2